MQEVQNRRSSEVQKYRSADTQRSPQMPQGVGVEFYREWRGTFEGEDAYEVIQSLTVSDHRHVQAWVEQAVAATYSYRCVHEHPRSILALMALFRAHRKVCTLVADFRNKMGLGRLAFLAYQGTPT